MKTWGGPDRQYAHLFCSLDPTCPEQCLELTQYVPAAWVNEVMMISVCVCVCVCTHTFNQPLLSVGHVWWWCRCRVVSDSVTPWTVARQAPLSMGSPGKKTGVGCPFLLQGTLLTQGSNPVSCIPGRPLLPSHHGSPWATSEHRWSLCSLGIYKESRDQHEHTWM